MLELATVKIGKFVRIINEKKEKVIIQKSGSSNLLVNWVYSIVVLRICVFVYLPL